MGFSTNTKALLTVLVLYAISILCRIPNLNRPLSKHHEFNPSTVLIAVEAWQQRGGAAPYGFVPLINYNNPGDYIKDKRWATDGKGNGIYLSYGPGMYAIPYFVFTYLHIAVTPLNLQFLNLFFLMLSVVMLYRLLMFIFRESAERYSLAVSGCFIFLFNPCILWFLGNGYVNVTISLPFLIGTLHQALILLAEKEKAGGRNDCWLSFFIIAGIYIDWNTFFAAVVISCFSIYRSIRYKHFPALAFVAALSAVAGIAFIIWQYCTYLPFRLITAYWKARFFTRSVEDTGMGFLQKLLSLANNLASGYLPVLLLAAVLLLPKKKAFAALPNKAKIYFLLSGCTCGLYNFTFFNWTYIHDFSLVPISVFLIFIPVVLMAANIQWKNMRYLFAAFFILCLAQYYYINRPGKRSQNGDAYATYLQQGTLIKETAQPDEMIFMPTQSPMINYYAKRFTFKAASKEDAIRKLREWHYPKGIWIEPFDGRMQKTMRITP